MSAADAGDAAGRLAHERRVTALMALDDLPEAEAQAICAAVLDVAGPPSAGFLLDLQAEAEAWAGRASAAELRAYGGAILGRLAGVALVEGWRKRLMVGLWESCPAAWRQAFLRRVDPEGRYRGRELRRGRKAA